MKKATFVVVVIAYMAICASGQPQKQEAAAPAQAQPVAATSATAPEAAAATAPVVTLATTRIMPNSKVYVAPMDNGFESYLMAAFRKKKVQLLPVAEKDQADYVITGTSVDKKAGWAKIVFMGNVHSDNAASINMSDRKSGVIVYAYAVDKKSTLHGQQTAAEACAKHLQAHIEGRE
jgi:hypothetical protein